MLDVQIFTFKAEIPSLIKQLHYQIMKKLKLMII